MSVGDRLGDLRRLVEEARTMPMSASVMVNRADLLDRLEALDRAVQEALTDAREVTEAKDDVVDSGRREAEGLLAAARDEQQRLASTTEVLRTAREQADDEVVEARRAAEALREEADAYVDHKLAGFEVALERTLETVRRGRERLTARDAATTSSSAPGNDAVVPGPGEPGDDEGDDEAGGGFW